MFKIVYSVLVYLQFKTLDQLKEQSRGKDNLYCKKTKYCISSNKRRASNKRRTFGYPH